MNMNGLFGIYITFKITGTHLSQVLYSRTVVKLYPVVCVQRRAAKDSSWVYSGFEYM